MLLLALVITTSLLAYPAGGHALRGTVVLWRNGLASPAYTSGRVQVYTNAWGNICSRSTSMAMFSLNEANVVCHQLGFSGASDYASGHSDMFGNDPLPFMLHSVNCVSPDLQVVLQCNHTLILDGPQPGHCIAHEDDVSVMCVASRLWDNPFTGQVRLSHGNYSSQGLVEVYCNGQWGTVCDDSFFQNELADTICRQLGYTEGTWNNDISGNESQPIWFDEIFCLAENEVCLQSCQRCPVGTADHNCHHNEDVTLFCIYNTGSSGAQSSTTISTCNTTSPSNTQATAGISCESSLSSSSNGSAINVSVTVNSGSRSISCHKTFPSNSQTTTGVVCSSSVSSCTTSNGSVTTSSSCNCSITFSSSMSNSITTESMFCDSDVPSATTTMNNSLPSITISNQSPWSVGPVTELLEVEEGRNVNLSCSLGNGDIPGVMYQWYKIVDGKQTPVPKAATILNDNETELNSVVTLDNIARTLYTNSAFLITVRVVQSTRGIAGTYVCRATSSAGSQERELIIRVKAPSGSSTHWYIRGTINGTFSTTFTTAQPFTVPVYETILLNSINESFEGIQTVKCKLVPRRPQDGTNERFECRIDQYLPPSPLTKILTVLTNVIETGNSPFGVSLPTSTPHSLHKSENGFCDVDVNEKGNKLKGTFHWPETRVGNTATVACPLGPEDVTATRHCEARMFWGRAITRGCTSRVTNELKNLQANNLLDANNISSVLNTLNTIVEQITEDDQTPENIGAVSNILRSTRMLSESQNLSLNTLMTAVNISLDIINTVEEWNKGVLNTASNQILNSLDAITRRMIEQQGFYEFTVANKDIAMQAVKVPRDQFQWQTFTVRTPGLLNITVSDKSFQSDLATDVNCVFTIPQEIRNVGSQSADVTIAFNVFRQPRLFQSRDSTAASNSSQNSSQSVGSYVVSASVNIIPDGTTLSSPIQYAMRLMNVGSDLDSTNITVNRSCAFWDFDGAGGNGSWNESGCNLVSYNETSNVVVCECNHLTNFAFLVDISSFIDTKDDGDDDNGTVVFPEGYLLALRIVTYLGISLSLAGLIVFFITHVAFRKFRQKDVTKFHLQLALSMTLLLLVVIPSGLITDIKQACTTVGVLIHYLLLVTFMWMLAEAVLMFQKLVIVFTKLTIKYIVIVSIICWGIPAIPVVISVAVDTDNYTPTISNVTGTPGICFVSNQAVFFGAVLSPILLVIISNTCLFIPVIYVVVKHALERNRQMNEDNRRISLKESCRLISILFGFMVLLGMTWILALLTAIGSKVNAPVAFAVHLLFNLFNTLQGFFVFVCFVLLSPEAREEWSNLLCRKYRPSSIRMKEHTKPLTLDKGTDSTKIGIVTEQDFADTSLSIVNTQATNRDQENSSPIEAEEDSIDMLQSEENEEVDDLTELAKGRSRARRKSRDNTSSNTSPIQLHRMGSTSSYTLL